MQSGLLRGALPLCATLETIEISRWGGPLPEADRISALEALERGTVLYFPNLAFEVADGEGGLLSPALSDGRAKNISLDPASRSLRGTRATGRERLHLQAMMDAFAAAASRLIRDLFPSYAASLDRPAPAIARSKSRAAGIRS